MNILKIISIITFIAFCQISFSQISIQSSDMPSPGDTITSSSAINTLGIDFESTGENYSWDFSSLISVGKQGDTFTNLNETPLIYQLAFMVPPNTANLAIYEGSVDTLAQIEITDIYQFLSKTTSAFKFVGVAFSMNGISFPMKFTSPDVLYEFPLQYNDSFNSVSEFETTFPGIGYYKTRKIRNNIVDGWGEVTTPYGQFQALRLKSEIEQYDSIYIDSLGIGLPVMRNFTEYKWLSPNMGIPLIQFTQEGIIVTATYIDSAETHQSVPEYAMQANFQVYPNPSNGLVYLKNNSANMINQVLFIYNLNGQQILSKDIPSDGNYSLNLKSCGIAKGVYFVVVRNNSEIIFKEKLIIK